MAKKLYELSLRDITPQSIAVDPQVQAIIAALDPELQSVSRDIREALIYSRIDDLPEPVLDLLAWQWHVDFYEPATLTLVSKRRIVKSAIRLHRLKGTRWAIEEGLRTIGVESKVIPWFEMTPKGAPYTFALDGWLMEGFRAGGAGILDDNTIRLIRRMVDETKSARDHLAGITLGIRLDEHVQAGDGEFDIWREIPIVERYPWGVQLHNGTAVRTALAHHDRAIFHNGAERHKSRRPGGTPHNAHIDDLGALEITLTGFEERLTSTVYRSWGIRHDGTARHGISGSPTDSGGEINILTGAFHNGYIRHNRGQCLTRGGIIRHDGTHTHYSGGNRHGWRERTVSF